MAFALDSGKTSLIVNTDIKNKNLDHKFNINCDFGIVDYLNSDDVTVDKILYETPIRRLRYIPSGDAQDDSTEHFTNNRITGLVESLLERYPERFPIISAPSVGSSADASILADSCDCVVLVAPYGKCTEIEIMHAIWSFPSEKFAGLILDDF